MAEKGALSGRALALNLRLHIAYTPPNEAKEPPALRAPLGAARPVPGARITPAGKAAP